jgi:hypothetical protein
MRYPYSANKLRVWLSVGFTVACATDFVVSRSSTALLGVLLGVFSTAVILFNLATGGEYRLWNYTHWPLIAALAIATILLVALQAPTGAFFAFALLLLLVALVAVVRRRMS